MLGAVEMCNNNGACRAFDAGVMCPSYRVTRDEAHLTRGRANTLRLALTGQFGAGCDGFGCGGRRDGAVRVVQGVQTRMPDRRRHGEDEDRGAGRARSTGTASSWRERLIAELPRYAPWIARIRAACQPAQPVAAAAPAGRAVAGFVRRRGRCRHGARDAFRDQRGRGVAPALAARRGLLLADTFNRYFEPENLRAALRCWPLRAIAPCMPEHRRPAVVLRPHVPGRRHGRQGARGGAPDAAAVWRRTCRSSGWNRPAC